MRSRIMVAACLLSGTLLACSSAEQRGRESGTEGAFGRTGHVSAGASYAEAIAAGMARARAEYVRRSGSSARQPIEAPRGVGNGK